jgi:hypothetical protein
MAYFSCGTGVINVTSLFRPSVFGAEIVMGQTNGVTYPKHAN